MKKPKIVNIVVFVVLLIVILFVSLVAINVFQNSQNTPNNDSHVPPQNTPSNAQLNNAGYLEGSKLYLVSANASYGVYSADMSWDGGTFDSQDCFVITATIRSDYTLEELQAMGVYPEGYPPDRVSFAVSATIYDGVSKVSTDDITSAIIGSMSPPLGIPQWRVYCGETQTVEIYVAINSRNISSYSIILKIIDFSGLPIP